MYGSVETGSQNSAAVKRLLLAEIFVGPGLRSRAETFPATSAADLSRTGKGKKKLFRKSVRCENVFKFYKTDPFVSELFDKNVNEWVFPLVR